LGRAHDAIGLASRGERIASARYHYIDLSIDDAASAVAWLHWDERPES
jgi:hypothetical protein